MTLNKKMRRSIWSWLALSPLVIVTLFPFAVMFLTAVKPSSEVLHPTWWPSRFVWMNFVTMWEATNFGSALANSLMVSVSATLIALAVSVPFAYALTRYSYSGKGVMAQFLLVSQMLSPIVLVIGLFRLVVWVGLVDSLSSIVIVYAAFNIAFTTWMLRSYFETIPTDLEEAAWIEGASRLTSLRRVFLPQAVPAIAVSGIFCVINAWNEFVIALTMLRQQESYTLPIQVFSLVAGRYTIEWNHVMAATLAATVPVALIFAKLQSYLVRGLSVGAVK